MSGVIAALHRLRVAVLHRDEPGCVGAVVGSGDRVVGERHDGRAGAAVEVAAGGDDLGAVLGHTLDPVRPFAGHLDRGFDRLGAGVHRQHHLGAGQLGEFRAERPKLVVVERSRGQRDLAQLPIAAAISAGWPVTEVQRRVAGEHVQVPLAGDVGDPGAVRRGDHHRQRVVVVRAPAVVEVEVELGVLPVGALVTEWLSSVGSAGLPKSVRGRPRNISGQTTEHGANSCASEPIRGRTLLG